MAESSTTSSFFKVNSSLGGKGLTAVMHAETRFGEDVLDVVGLAPINVNMLYPSLNNETAITGLQFEQALHDGWSLSAGKINSLDFFYAIYPQTGRGVDGFMNASMIMPLAYGTHPSSGDPRCGRAEAAGFADPGRAVCLRQQRRLDNCGLVTSLITAPTSSAFGEFSRTSAANRARIFCRHLGQWPVHVARSVGLGDPAWPRARRPVAAGSWWLLYTLEQKLWVDPCDRARSLGLLSAWSLADKKTSPVPLDMQCRNSWARLGT